MKRAATFFVGLALAALPCYAGPGGMGGHGGGMPAGGHPAPPGVGWSMGTAPHGSAGLPAAHGSWSGAHGGGSAIGGSRGPTSGYVADPHPAWVYHGGVLGPASASGSRSVATRMSVASVEAPRVVVVRGQLQYAMGQPASLPGAMVRASHAAATPLPVPVGPFYRIRTDTNPLPPLLPNDFYGYYAPTYGGGYYPTDEAETEPPPEAPAPEEEQPAPPEPVAPPEQTGTARGTISAIGQNTFTLRTAQGDVTFEITEQTTAGDVVHLGDRVDVSYRTAGTVLQAVRLERLP